MIKLSPNSYIKVGTFANVSSDCEGGIDTIDSRIAKYSSGAVEGIAVGETKIIYTDGPCVSQSGTIIHVVEYNPTITEDDVRGTIFIWAIALFIVAIIVTATKLKNYI